VNYFIYFVVFYFISYVTFVSKKKKLCNQMLLLSSVDTSDPCLLRSSIMLFLMSYCIMIYTLF
jgi:hypothetical protein